MIHDEEGRWTEGRVVGGTGRVAGEGAGRRGREEWRRGAAGRGGDGERQGGGISLQFGALAPISLAKTSRAHCIPRRRRLDPLFVYWAKDSALSYQFFFAILEYK